MYLSYIIVHDNLTTYNATLRASYEHSFLLCTEYYMETTRCQELRETAFGYTAGFNQSQSHGLGAFFGLAWQNYPP